jgi:hypothetical protein
LRGASRPESEIIARSRGDTASNALTPAPAKNKRRGALVAAPGRHSPIDSLVADQAR